MAGCAHPGCDGDDRMRYECLRCGQLFCPDHRLPEAHNCYGSDARVIEARELESDDADGSFVVGLLIILVGVGVVLGAGFVIATSLPPLTVPSPDLGGGGATAAANTTATATPTATATATPTAAAPSGNAEYNRTEVERMFIVMLNEERQSRGLQPVTQRDELTEMGVAHSQSMAENDYIGHEEPDGSTIEDRYRERGLLPECRLPVEGSQEYYPGAENANAVHIGSYETTYNEFVTIQSEQEIARVLFEEWMHSPGHRKAMLVSSADEAGLGIWINEKGVVYSSLELC